MNRFLIAGIVLLSATVAAIAHSKKEHGEKQALVPANLDMVENAFGKTGDPGMVSKTIKVTMSDEMRFEPAVLQVKVGDTIRILAQNDGELLHEMVIGRTSDLLKHAKVMQMHPNMKHSNPFMAHADEGQTAEIIWTFSKPGTFEFGCLIPGHYESGMKGTIVVSK